MFGSGVLDTAIGLIFVFLLVSLLVTVANELISSVMLSRAKWLQFGVARLLGSEWAKRLYQHPLISGTALSSPAQIDAALPWRGSGPSYIPSRSFVNVLLDLVREGDKTLQPIRSSLQGALDAARDQKAPLDVLKAKLMDAVSKVIPHPDAATTLSTDLTRLLADMPVGDDASPQWLVQLEGVSARIVEPSLSALKSELDSLVAKGKSDPVAEPLREGLKAAIDSMPYAAVGQAVKQDLDALLGTLGAPYTVGDARNDIQRFIDSMPARYLRETIQGIEVREVRETLLVLMDDAQNDLEKFKQNIEIWFNNAMDRVGGWYKRRSQTVVAVLGLSAAVVLNVDALLIVRHLDIHPGVRDALVAQAKAFADSPPPRVTRKSSEGAGTNAAAPAASAPDAAGLAASAAASAPGVADNDVDPSVLVGQFGEVQRQLMQLSLPIGWVSSTAGSTDDKTRYRVNPFSGGPFWATLWFHLLGWLITALAATLGAPFWFDTLNRVIAIRSAGKAPEETPRPPKEVPLPLEPGQSPREADALKFKRL